MTKKKLRKGTEKYSRNLLSTRYQSEVRVPGTRWGVQGTEVGEKEMEMEKEESSWSWERESK